jgi:hypothetical protein
VGSFGLSPFAWVLAGVPLASYLMLLAMIALRGRPLVTSGGRDLAALAIGLSGLVAIGPMQLFYPPLVAPGAALRVTVAMLLFFALCVIFAVLLMRPRLVIYNANRNDVRSALHRAADAVLPGSTLENDGVYFPPADVRLRIDGGQHGRVWQIMSWGTPLRPSNWRALRLAFARELGAQATARPTIPWALLIVAVGLSSIVLWQLWQRPIEVASGLREFLRM